VISDTVLRQCPDLQYYFDAKAIQCQIVKGRIGGVVYIVAWKPSGPVKVGMTSEPWNRIRNIETSIGRKLGHICLTPYSLNYIQAEASMHDALAAYRGMGEWFDIPFKKAVEILKEQYLDIIEYPFLKQSKIERKLADERAKNWKVPEQVEWELYEFDIVPM
jgi:hypothetical protein